MNNEDLMEKAMKEAGKFDEALHAAFAKVNDPLDEIEACLLGLEARLANFDERISALEKH